MNKQFTKVLAIVLLTFSTVSCGSDDEGPDTTAPQVTIETPTADQEFTKGANLPLKAEFTDDRELSECTVSLSFNPEPAGSSALKGITDPWTPEDAVIALSGKTDNKDLANIFATSIEGTCKSGSYTLTFVVKDKAGNTSSSKTVDITIQ